MFIIRSRSTSTQKTLVTQLFNLMTITEGLMKFHILTSVMYILFYPICFPLYIYIYISGKRGHL